MFWFDTFHKTTSFLQSLQLKVNSFKIIYYSISQNQHFFKSGKYIRKIIYLYHYEQVLPFLSHLRNFPACISGSIKVFFSSVSSRIIVCVFPPQTGHKTLSSLFRVTNFFSSALISQDSLLRVPNIFHLSNRSFVLLHT